MMSHLTGNKPESESIFLCSEPTGADLLLSAAGLPGMPAAFFPLADLFRVVPEEQINSPPQRHWAGEVINKFSDIRFFFLTHSPLSIAVYE